MVSIRAIVVLAIVVFAMAMTSDAAPMPMPAPMPFPKPGLLDALFPRAMARARANDRGANSFAGGAGCRIGGSAINPDPFAFPGSSPFPAAPLCI